MWAAESLKEVATLQRQGPAITALAFLPNDGLVAGNAAGDLSVWDRGSVGDWSLLHKVKAHNGAITHVAVHPEDRVVATTSTQPSSIRFWILDDNRSAECISRAQPGIQQLSRTCFTPDIEPLKLVVVHAQGLEVWATDAKEAWPPDAAACLRKVALGGSELASGEVRCYSTACMVGGQIAPASPGSHFRTHAPFHQVMDVVYRGHRAMVCIATINGNVKVWQVDPALRVPGAAALVATAANAGAAPEAQHTPAGQRFSDKWPVSAATSGPGAADPQVSSKEGCKVTVNPAAQIRRLCTSARTPALPNSLGPAAPPPTASSGQALLRAPEAPQPSSSGSSRVALQRLSAEENGRTPLQRPPSSKCAAQVLADKVIEGSGAMKEMLACAGLGGEVFKGGHRSMKEMLRAQQAELKAMKGGPGQAERCRAQAMAVQTGDACLVYSVVCAVAPEPAGSPPTAGL